MEDTLPEERGHIIRFERLSSDFQKLSAQITTLHRNLIWAALTILVIAIITGHFKL
jgi:hypothetical protein